MKLKLVLAGLTIWAITATLLIFLKPDVSRFLNNWIFQRQTMQGHMFLTANDGPEGFVAFGNETHVFCEKPCTVEEMGTETEHGLVMCESQWEGRKHICIARFWPGRNHIVQSKRVRAKN